MFTDVGELRVKEVDRLAAVADMVEAFGATAAVEGDTLSITGVGGPLRGARFDSRGDHRMAMAAAVAALAARPGERSLITGFDAVETSYPGFADELERLAEGGGVGAAPPPRGHRRSGRGREVHRVDRRGGSTRGRASRHRGHVPRRGRPRARAGHGTGRRRRRGGAGRRLDDRSRGAGHHRRARCHGADPHARRSAAPSPSWRPTPRSAAIWSSASGPGPTLHGGGVVEGRDIGSVVFPHAHVKVYLTASPEERARRRNDEAPEGVARRDRIDSTRDASPLREAEDAHRLDTTGRTVQDVVEEVMSWL